MREIKLRGFRNVLGDKFWVYGYGAIDNEILTLDFTKGIVRVECESGSIGQFTGLRDKNGKEIYVGDLLRDGDGNIFEVRWNKFSASFTLIGKRYHFLFAQRCIDLLEVIGNVYENPELLEE